MPNDFTIRQVAAMGGRARALALSAKRRREIARYAVACREKKRRAAKRAAAKAAREAA